LKSSIHDAEQFIENFDWAIQHNPAHIYLSALPFTRQNTLISTYFRKAFPNVLRLSVDPAEEPQPVMTAAVSGELIAVVTVNASLKVFDREGAEVFHTQINPIERSDRDRYCIAISGKGMMVALGHDNCYVWNLGNGGTRKLVLAQGIVARTTCLAFSDDGERIVTGFNHGNLHEWVVNSGMEGRHFLWPSDGDDKRQDRVIAAVYAQTDDRIISSSQTNSGQPRFHVWSRSGDCTFSYLLPEKCQAFSLSSHWLISACYDANNELWQTQDPLTGELQFICSPMPREYMSWYGRNDRWNLFAESDDPVSAISSDGKLAAFGLNKHASIFIWDVHENIQLAELVGHTDRLTSVAFAASRGKESIDWSPPR
jgi:WD40 repeat protein